MDNGQPSFLPKDVLKSGLINYLSWTNPGMYKKKGKKNNKWDMYDHP